MDVPLIWEWNPWVEAGGVLLLAGYTMAARQWHARAIVFAAGVAVLLLALVSPLDNLAEHLFSAHMVQHLLLVLIGPMLLTIGLTENAARRIFRMRFLGGAESGLSRPVVAWTAGIAAMAAWHIPALFNAAMASPLLAAGEHVSLVVCGVLFWWPIFSPLPDRRLTPFPAAIVYLAAACMACTIIGVLITFSPPGVYPRYGGGVWGISPSTDHQLGGILMWVPGCLLYLSLIMAMFARWYGAPEQLSPEALTS